MRYSMNILTVVFCLLFAASVRGQIPSERTCLASLEEVGVDSLQSTLVPCAFGASASCCASLVDLVGFNSDSQFSGCMCNEGVLDLVVAEIEGNSLAQSIGFTGDAMIDVLATCNAPFYGTPACPALPPVQVEASGVVVIPVVGSEPEMEEQGETSRLRAGLNRQRRRREERRGALNDATSSGKYKKKKDGVSKAKDAISGIDLPDPKDSSTFEIAHDKIEVMLNNLKNTRDIITDSKIDKKRAAVDHKASSTAWDDYEISAADHKPLFKNGDIVQLVPVERDIFNRGDFALPVDVRFIQRD